MLSSNSLPTANIGILKSPCIELPTIFTATTAAAGANCKAVASWCRRRRHNSEMEFSKLTA